MVNHGGPPEDISSVVPIITSDSVKPVYVPDDSLYNSCLNCCTTPWTRFVISLVSLLRFVEVH